MRPYHTQGIFICKECSDTHQKPCHEANTVKQEPSTHRWTTTFLHEVSFQVKSKKCTPRPARSLCKVSGPSSISFANRTPTGRKQDAERGGARLLERPDSTWSGSRSLLVRRNKNPQEEGRASHRLAFLSCSLCQPARLLSCLLACLSVSTCLPTCLSALACLPPPLSHKGDRHVDPLRPCLPALHSTLLVMQRVHAHLSALQCEK